MSQETGRLSDDNLWRQALSRVDVTRGGSRSVPAQIDILDEQMIYYRGVHLDDRADWTEKRALELLAEFNPSRPITESEGAALKRFSEDLRKSDTWSEDARWAQTLLTSKVLGTKYELAHASQQGQPLVDLVAYLSSTPVGRVEFTRYFSEATKGGTDSDHAFLLVEFLRGHEVRELINYGMDHPTAKQRYDELSAKIKELTSLEQSLRPDLLHQHELTKQALYDTEESRTIPQKSRDAEIDGRFLELSDLEKFTMRVTEKAAAETDPQAVLDADALLHSLVTDKMRRLISLENQAVVEGAYARIHGPANVERARRLKAEGKPFKQVCPTCDVEIGKRTVYREYTQEEYLKSDYQTARGEYATWKERCAKDGPACYRDLLVRASNLQAGVALEAQAALLGMPDVLRSLSAAQLAAIGRSVIPEIDEVYGEAGFDRESNARDDYLVKAASIFATLSSRAGSAVTLEWISGESDSVLHDRLIIKAALARRGPVAAPPAGTPPAVTDPAPPTAGSVTAEPAL